MRARGEEDARRAFSVDFPQFFKILRVVNHDLSGVPNADPDLMATRCEFHVEDCGARFELMDDLLRHGVDHLNRVVQWMGEIDPDLATVWTRNCEYWLPVASIP